MKAITITPVPLLITGAKAKGCVPFPSGRGAGPSGACVGFHSLTVIEVYHSALAEYRTKEEKYDRLFLGFRNGADADRQRQREGGIQQHTGSPAQRQ